MRFVTRLLKPVLYCALVVLFGTGIAFSAEQDDSNLFVDAFNAFHKKDYIRVIEKADQLYRLFPDTPLRDVSLLLQARAALKSGDRELAAKVVNQFQAEFADSTLKASIEDDLLKLGTRLKKGEKLLPDKKLQAAAQKVRTAHLEQERATALKAEQERIAKEKAERERVLQAKAEAERRERERIAAEIAAKTSIRLAILLPESSHNFAAGTAAQLPVQLVNKGTVSEEFLLTTTAEPEYAVLLTAVDKPGAMLERISLAPGESFKGNLTFRMPDCKVDGFRSRLSIKAVSAKFSDVAFDAESEVITSAPLVRVVARPNTAASGRGKPLSYRITVLNAGSLAARGLKVRVILPEQTDLLETTDNNYQQESAGVASFEVDALEPGNLKEFSLNVKVRESAPDKQELLCRIEVINDSLKLKDTFISSPSTVGGKVTPEKDHKNPA